MQPPKMDLAPLLEKYPQLEQSCRNHISAIYEEILGNEPVPEIHDYILNEGIKSNPTRSEMMKEFQILFNEKTEMLVKWLFEVLRPTIRLEAAKIDKADRPNRNSDDLL